jgi:hypothetical protein
MTRIVKRYPGYVWLVVKFSPGAVHRNLYSGMKLVQVERDKSGRASEEADPGSFIFMVFEFLSASAAAMRRKAQNVIRPS